MTERLRIALAQLNPTVGAISANLEKARKAIAEAEAQEVDILMFTELYLTGYFPEDLLFKRQFVTEAMEAAKALAQETRGLNLSLVLPTIWSADGNLYNAVILAEDGAIIDRRYKVELPNDDIFYERRYFTPGPLPQPMTIAGISIGVPICEDVWHEPVCKTLAEQGAELLLCPNGSPYWRNKQRIRVDLVKKRVADAGVPILYSNQVGGQDELIFDGASFGINIDGSLAFQGKSFIEELVISDWEKRITGWHCVEGKVTDLVPVNEAPWHAAMLGLRDYVHKNGFTSVVLGLSGGIDSAVVAAIAVDALGAENVHCVMLPYRYTSEASLHDAKACAETLGVRYDIVPIGAPVDAVNENLSEIFAGRKPDITEENLQSRMRGTILMAISNKLGSLLITTGNKSEMAVGYATIYGDMNGAYNPIKDMLKMQVYGLAEWRNSYQPSDVRGPAGIVIPPNIIAKAPSAELRPDQTDQDSLPPYPVLDAIIEAIVEKEQSLAEIVEQGFEPELVKRIERLIYIAEFKRRQAAPGPKLTPKAFGIGRKYPITSGYRDGSLCK
ncbi:NAD+ synthase [Pelagibacterium lentulum]|uniref:Glutamine-dependent NAD(+) synthetase n=1 Tax=Pelagibacterium lentulum TaxID=2029865 RepID=A0A916RBW2_9HYPH|nr:NAD+ synthase [Pelagibacterium lentulum]GGA49083.1 NAD+ synthase [Pelagibacterium lentulum]